MTDLQINLAVRGGIFAAIVLAAIIFA